MRKNRGYTTKQLVAPMAAACLLFLGIIFYPRMTGELRAVNEENAPVMTGNGADAATESALLPGRVPAQESSRTEGLRISEIMAKNHASFRDELGGIPDWIELENSSENTISLLGLSLSDNERKPGWPLPDRELAPGERLLVYADGGNIRDGVLHTDFSLSYGEWVYLRDESGLVVSCAECSSDAADTALMLDENGGWTESMFPSPGYSNDENGYALWQSGLTADSPLMISEVMVYNNSRIKQVQLGYCDWVELKNASEESVELSDYYLSDDDDMLQQWQLPKRKLEPGDSVVILCSKEEPPADAGYVKLGFELSSDGEQLFLSDSQGIVDMVFVHDVPYGASFGRLDGEAGWFYMASPSPGEPNADGKRLISRSPEAAEADGIFDGVDSVTVTLSAGGDIYYTLDGSRPTEGSSLYTVPLQLSSTTVLRAIAIEEDRLESPCLNLSYIINEGHTLPVMSLVTDSPEDFRRMYDGRKKDVEVPGALALFEADGGFAIPCGIELHGQTSLELPKKNMSVRFRTAYGQASLDYDAFGGGVTEFTNFVLRSGQDYNRTIIRNELLENLALRMGGSLLTQRSKQCVLYVNGEYRGLYVLMEKLNEQHYASHYGVTKDSVTVVRDWAGTKTDFHREVISFVNANDLSQKAPYEEFCRIVDIDSLIDWIIAEGYSGNTDISSGNLRYCRSTEGDGKWRFMFYDMDATMGSALNCFGNVMRPSTTECAQFIVPLMSNEQFKQRFLTRAAEMLESVFSNESVLAEIDRLSALIAPEVPRDRELANMQTEAWEQEIEELKNSVIRQDRARHCMDNIAELFVLSAEEKQQYFGS